MRKVLHRGGDGDSAPHPSGFLGKERGGKPVIFCAKWLDPPLRKHVQSKARDYGVKQSGFDALKLRPLPFTHPVYVASRYFQ